MMNLSKPFFPILLILVYLTLSGCSNGEEAEDSVSPMKHEEQQALYTAIQGFVGNSWNGTDLYPDPCGWTPIQGVSCDLFDGFWYVTELNIGSLHDNSLSCGKTVEFRPQLFQLTHLKSLSFFNCFAFPQDPITIPTGFSTWGRLRGGLEALEFRSNPGLVGQIPPELSQLRKLQSLVLLENGLKGQIPSDLGNLQRLRRLVLSANNLTGQIPESLGNLSGLLILDLSRNLLSGSLPSSFGGLTSLLKLDLSSNMLTGKIPSEISKLKNLTLFDLGKNRFAGGLEIPFWEMESLEELLLSNNPLGGELKSVEWEKMRNLVILDLSNVGLGGEIPESIAKMRNLRFLILSNNNLTGMVSPSLVRMPSLSALYVNWNNLGGKLEYPNNFMGKMGKRLKVEGNPKLCFYTSGSSSHIPPGLEPCQSEVTFYDQKLKSKVGDDGNQEESVLVASSAVVRYGINGIWGAFLVEMLILGLFRN